MSPTLEKFWRHIPFGLSFQSSFHHLVFPSALSFVYPSHFYAPAMIIAGALSVTPVRTYVRLSRRRPLSNLNIFYQNFMKLGHIVKYLDVFFKFDNGPYCTRLSRVMALCLWKFLVLNDVRSLTRKFFIRILWNLVTLLSTMMSSSSLIMVHIAPCFL